MGKKSKQSTKSLLQTKIELLDTLIFNLKKEEEFLNYRDADSAVSLEFKNETIVSKLEQLDRQIYETKDREVYTSDEIFISEQVFEKLDLAREIQKKVQILLEFEMNESKKELWEFRIKRKLKNHFYQNSGLSWTKNYC